MNTRMEELELAIQSKGSRLNHVEQDIHQLKEEMEKEMAAIELRIEECIPDNLTEQLAALERSFWTADKKKASELREKQLIESSPPTVQYYVTVQVSVNGVLNACTSISSEMVRNERRGFAGSIASAIGTFSSLADPIPFAKFGLDILKGALNKWAEEKQKPAVPRRLHRQLPGGGGSSSEDGALPAVKAGRGGCEVTSAAAAAEERTSICESEGGAATCSKYLFAERRNILGRYRLSVHTRGRYGWQFGDPC